MSDQTVYPGLFTVREKILFLIDLEAGKCWRWSGGFGEGIVLLLLPRFESQISSIYPSYCTDNAAMY
jgi:hypothetical protein